MMIVRAAIAAVIIISMIGMLSYPTANIKAQLTASQLPAKEPPRATQLPAPAQEPPKATQLPVLPQFQEQKHLPVETVQDDHVIVTTVTKTNKPIQGPIVILPPKQEGGNSTIVEPGQNVTNNNNETVIIGSDGNVTQVPNGNITQIDNETTIITEPGRNITETPGNVTVIDPPRPAQLPALPNENSSGNNAGQCTCNNNTQAGKLPPVIIKPAPGQNVTQLPSQPETGANTPPSSSNTTMPPPFQQQPGNNFPSQQPVKPNDNQTNNQGSNQTASTQFSR